MGSATVMLEVCRVRSAPAMLHIQTLERQCGKRGDNAQRMSPPALGSLRCTSRSIDNSHRDRVTVIERGFHRGGLSAAGAPGRRAEMTA
jgi:hypothetical protein